LRYLSKLILLGLLYFTAGKLGLHISVIHPSASAIWAPTGIAMAAMVLLGYRMWPAIFIGAYLVNITTFGSVFSSLGIALGNTLEGLLGAYFISIHMDGEKAFEKPWNVVQYIILASLVSTLVSPTVGLTSLAIWGYASWSNYVPIWLTWWIGDIAGSLFVAPLILLWAQPSTVSWDRYKVLEAATIVSIVTLLTLAVFKGFAIFGGERLPAGYLCILPILWTAYRFGPRETTSVSFIPPLIILWSTMHGLGPFPLMGANRSLIFMSLFIDTLAMTGLFIAAEFCVRRKGEEILLKTQALLEQRVEERTESLTRTDADLRNERARFRQLVNSNIIGFMQMDKDGRVFDANDALLKMIGYQRDDLAGPGIYEEALTAPPFRTLTAWIHDRLEAVGTCPPIEMEFVRKDGCRVPMLVGTVLMQGTDHHRLCFVVDATERRAAMDAMRKAYDELELRVQQRTAELQEEVQLRQRAEDELRNQATHDPLTGLCNWRGFEDLAGSLIKIARRQNKPVLLFMADLDDLKVINDTFGHAEGDWALTHLAGVLTKTFRKSDAVARLGGDEFAMVAIKESKGPDEDIAHRLEAAINELNRYSGKPYHLRMSFGTTTMEPSDTTSLRDLMREADAELYEKKKHKDHSVLKG
jgi:diguanylate cyclase (GGDEF)-like protein/PAS domain S-box-containing protein